MVSSSDDLYGVATSRFTVSAGSTLAFFVDAIAGQKSLMLSYFSGGTCEIFEAINGTTMNGTTLASFNNTGNVLAAGQVLSLDGSPRFYVNALGATSILQVIKGKSAGT